MRYSWSAMETSMRGVLAILAAGFACSAQGGTITSGSFSISALPSSSQATWSATVSGETFAATIIHMNAVIGFSGLPPFQLSLGGPVGISWGGDSSTSGVLYNGVFYGAPPFAGPKQGMPFSFTFFNATLISPPPIITGPGTYSLLFSVTLQISLFDSCCTSFHSETDTGFATGSVTYTPIGNLGYVTSNGIEATIIPEPSTWSCIAFGACCLGAFAGISFRRQLLDIGSRNN